MAITVPPAKNYQSPLVGVPTFWNRPPKEGAKMVPVEINWATMGGANNCVNINLQNNATLEFSQIVTLSVDNSLCAADVIFIFPDTGETVSIPSYAPKCVVPVFTNQVQFYVYAPGAQAQDTTRFSIHNSVPPPVSVPFTQEQQALNNSNITADGTTMAQLLPTTVDGTLEAISVSRHGPLLSAGTQSFQITDGDVVLNIGGRFSSTNQTTNVIILQINPMTIRFLKGLKFSQTGDNMGGYWSVNALFRQP